MSKSMSTPFPLPFLYQTPTILRRSYASDAFGEITTLDLKRQARNKISADWSKVNRSPTRQRRTPIKPLSPRRSHEFVRSPPPLPPPPRERIDHVPFEGIDDRPATILARLHGQTMTRHEFNVFKDILAKGAMAETAVEDAAKKKHRKDSTGRARGVVREDSEMPPLLRPLAEEAETIAAQRRRENEVEVLHKEEMVLQEEQTSREYRIHMETAMSSATTDAQLWDIFNTSLRKDMETALAHPIDHTNNDDNGVNLTTLTTALPPLLLHLSAVLTSHFPGSPYSLSLLPTLRNMGPSALTLGATTDLFNIHLRHLFEVYGDLHGMAAVLEEMERDVYEFNEGTSRVLEDVFMRASRAESGEYGSAVRAWWGTERRGRGLELLEWWEGVVAERRGRAEARRVEVEKGKLGGEGKERREMLVGMSV